MKQYSFDIVQEKSNIVKMEQQPASFESEDKPLVEKLNDEFTKTVLPVTVFVGLEVVVGFFGNLLVIYVFLFRYHVCNFRYFVLCLAFNDLVSTLTTMPGEIVTHLYWYVYPIEEVCKVKSFFNMFTVCAEALCLLTISIDRYRKVCKPFGWQIKPRIAVIVCLFIYIVSGILATPVPFLWGISHRDNVYKGVNVTTTICEKDGKYKQTKRPIQYSITMETVLSIILIAMFALYVLIARTLLKTKRKKRSSGKSSDAQTSSSNTGGLSLNNVMEMNALSEHSNHLTGMYHRHEDQDRQHDTAGKTKLNIPKQTDRSGKEKRPSSLKVWQIVPSGKSTDNEVPTDESRGPTTSYDEDGAAHRHIHRKFNSTKQSLKSRKRTVRTRVRRKTLIMFVLTLIFMITTVLYLTLLSFIARSDDVLHNMSNAWKAIYFLCFRLYFINHVINPIVYGLLDPHFQTILRKMKS